MLDAKGRYPNVYGQDDAWRLRVRVWLVQHPGGLLLFDTGLARESSPAMDWCPEPGVAAASLAEVGAAPEMIDVVALSHAHDDHIGGILSGEGAPAFPRARYLLQRADDAWRRGMDQDDRSPRSNGWLLRSSGPVRWSCWMGTIGSAELIELRHAPGHTPGHQILRVASDGAHALLSADIAAVEEERDVRVLLGLGDAQLRGPAFEIVSPRLS